MTKLLLFFLALLTIGMAVIYLTIPSKIIFANIVYLNTGKSSAQRYVADNRNWNKWWPEDSSDSKKATTDTLHIYKNFIYSVDNTMQDGMTVSITHKENKVNTVMYLVQLNVDSVAIEWRGEMPETNNPFKRLFYYKLAHDTKKNMGQVLQQAKSFLSQTEKIYGLKILHEMVKDTVLISTRKFSTNYPDPRVIYAMIADLEEHVKLKNGQVTNFPMLHVIQDSSGFTTMVALPLRNEIPETSDFRIKRMVAGKILAVEVKGGVNTTKETIKKMELYMDDYHIKSPAIYFESLVTNRIREVDTAKWITKVYYPVY